MLSGMSSANRYRSVNVPYASVEVSSWSQQWWWFRQNHQHHWARGLEPSILIKFCSHSSDRSAELNLRWGVFVYELQLFTARALSTVISIFPRVSLPPGQLQQFMRALSIQLNDHPPYFHREKRRKKSLLWRIVPSLTLNISACWSELASQHALDFPLEENYWSVYQSFRISASSYSILATRTIDCAIGRSSAYETNFV